ncbi:MAG: oligopeptidase B, partial [Bryobacteraceae bacterium]
MRTMLANSFKAAQALLASFSGVALLAQSVMAPPVAPQVDHREVRHGATIVDEYYWVREKTNPEVIGYLEAENAYTAAMTKDLQPFQETLYNEMLARIKQTDLSVPIRQGPYLYYSRTEEGKQYPIQCRRRGNMESPEEILLDLNELAKEHKFVGLGAFVVSDDQNQLAYTLDYTGFRQYSLRVKDLRNGETLPDTTERVTSLAWAGDNKTLFLTTEDATTKRANKLWRHVLRSVEFEPLYEEKDELYDIGVGKTRDKRYILLGSESKDTTEFRYLRADRAQDSFTIFLPREKKHRYYVDHREGLFYIRTNKGGHNFEILTAPENNPNPKNWTVFVPHRTDVLIEDIDLFKDFAVTVEKSQALTQLRVHNFHTGAWTPIQFPEPVYFASPGGTRDYESTTYRYNYQSFITSQSVYDYDTQTGKSSLLKRQEVLGGYDPSQYVSERLWATARDGVRVPISIVYK